eukprot:10556993-Alexandrium_andersonii.AAC.1
MLILRAASKRAKSGRSPNASPDRARAGFLLILAGAAGWPSPRSGTSPPSPRSCAGPASSPSNCPL